MPSKNILIAILAVAVAVLGYYLYQESQTESVSIKLGDQELSIESK